MTELKNEIKWLKEVDSTALQNAIQDLGEAFSSFYEKSKGKPKYKSKRNEIQSYTTKCNYNKSGATIQFEKESFIRLPKLGLVKFAKSKDVKGEYFQLQFEDLLLESILYQYWLNKRFDLRNLPSSK